MQQLLAIVVPLSLGAAVSATALAVIILTLSGKVAPRARAWAETAGFVLALTAVTAVVAVFAQAIMNFSPNPTIMAGTDVLAGVILLGLAVHTAVARKNGEGKERKKKAPSDKAGAALPAYFMLGVVLLVTDVTSLVLYFPALKDILQAAQAKHVTVEQAWMVALIPYFAVIAPVLVPTVLGSVAPDLTDRVLKPFGAWVDGHSKVIALVIELAFGIFLIAKGGMKLLGH